MPQAPFTPNELNLAWRRWIQLETRRRTAYLVYHLDTISALESNIPCILSSCEISLMPLPAPDTLWKAATAEEWHAAVQKYKPMTLDEAMRRIFYLPTYGAFDTLHEKADTKYYNLLNKSDYGPFARVAMVLTLLRGIMDIGEGKRDRGDWRDLTDLWVSCSWLKPHKKMLSSDGTDLGHITRESLRGRFAMGLEKVSAGMYPAAVGCTLTFLVATRLGLRLALPVGHHVVAEHLTSRRECSVRERRYSRAGSEAELLRGCVWFSFDDSAIDL